MPLIHWKATRTVYVDTSLSPRHYYNSPLSLLPIPIPQRKDYSPPPHCLAYLPSPPSSGYYYYEAERDCRPGPHYRERVVAPPEHVHRGDDGRYYYRRGDETTGLIIGAAAGSILGDLVARGHSQVIDTLFGAGGGALLGQSIDRNSVHCR